VQDSKNRRLQAGKRTQQLISALLTLGLSTLAGFSFATDWLSQAGAVIPAPKMTHTAGQTLTLRDAIFLALRNNPDVESAELQRVNDKFSLLMAYNTFFPTYTLSSTATLPNEGKSSYGTTAGFDWKSPLGTDVSASYTKDYTGGPGATTLTVTQPLLRGFGYKYNTIAFQDSLDSELSAKLTYKDSIISTVVSVITAYRGLVSQYNQFEVKKKTFKQNEEQYKQNQLEVKAGKLSESSLLQKQAALETFRLSYVSAQNTVQTSYKALLTALGLSPTAKIKIDKHILLPKNYHTPNLAKTIGEALQGNISYVKTVIGLRSTERALYQAKRNRWWQLSLQSTNTFGFNGQSDTSGDTGPDLEFTLTVPINDLASEQALVQAKISLINAKNQLITQKRKLISDVTQQLQSIENLVEQVKISKLQTSLQAKTVKNTQIKLKYGKSTMFELNSEQTNLLQAQINFIGAQINLLGAITGLNQTLGKTLDIWGIKLRY
jgi:outer membrane protein TolC